MARYARLGFSEQSIHESSASKLGWYNITTTFPLLSLPRELRDRVYYFYLLKCKRELPNMSAGHCYWPTPKLLLVPPSPRIEREFTHPLEVVNFFLAAPHSSALDRQTYGWSPEKLTNLLCISPSVRREAEEVLYRGFIFFFHYGLYESASGDFVSEVSAAARLYTRAFAFVLRLKEIPIDSWSIWEKNSEILAEGFKGLRVVSFEIQADGRAEESMVTQAREGIVWKLLAVAQPFTSRGVDVQWVGVSMGMTLAELCHEESAT